MKNVSWGWSIYIYMYCCTQKWEIWGGEVQNRNQEIEDFSEGSEDGGRSTAMYRGGKEVWKLRWRNKLVNNQWLNTDK